MTVRITLEAPRAAGKSFIGNIIASKLREMGYDVEVDHSVWPHTIPDDARGIGKVVVRERLGSPE